MLTVIDALTRYVSEELPDAVAPGPSPADIRHVTEILLDSALDDVDAKTILAAARDLGLTGAAATVTLTRTPPGFSARMLAVLAAADILPLPLTDLDRLLTEIAGERLVVSRSQLYAAALTAGLGLRVR